MAVTVRVFYLSCLTGAILCVGPLEAATVGGYFLADQEIVIYHSDSANELGERQTRSTSAGYLFFDLDLHDGVTQYVHFVVAGSSDPAPYFIGSLELEDGGFVFPNGDYLLSTDAVHWVGNEGGLGSANHTITDLGANGTEPWGYLEGVPSDAHFIWTGTGTGDRFFSVRIEPGDPAAIHTVEYSNDDAFVRSSTGSSVSRSFADQRTMITVDSDRGVIGGRSEAVLSEGKDSTAIYGSAGFEATDFIVTASVEDNRIVGEEPPLPFTEGIYLKVGDIKGESTAEGYEEWIDVDDFGSRISRSKSLSRRVSATPGDLVVMKHLDASSPRLLEGLTQGIVFPEALLVANLPERGGSRAVFEYRLKKAAVTEFNATGDGGDLSPIEAVALDYERVDWIYRLIGSDGSKTGEVVAWWDVETGTGGSSSSTGGNTPPVIETVANQPVGSGEEGSVELSIGDDETASDALIITLSTDRPDLLTGLKLLGSGPTPKITFATSALRSGFASINVTLSDGTDTRSISIPVLIDVEMTPYEGYLAAYFAEDEMFDPFLSAPLLDPDGDGLATQLEYLFGTNPREFNPASDAMTIAPDPESGGGAVTVSFKRRIDDPNVEGFFWGSDDMETWVRYDVSNPLYEETTKEGENPLYEEVTATVTLPSDSKPAFIRYQSVGVF